MWHSSTVCSRHGMVVYGTKCGGSMGDRIPGKMGRDGTSDGRRCWETARQMVFVLGNVIGRFGWLVGWVFVYILTPIVGL